MTNYTAVGRSIPRGEGPNKVSGKAVYTADVIMPGMLWGKVLRSPFPHARIVHVDTSRAQSVPGVYSVLSGQDLPDARIGRRLRDIPVLARDRVRFVGEKVAAVAAVDRDVAEEALSLIDVEYEELPTLFDPLEAMREGAPELHPDLSSYEGLPGPVSPGSNVFCSHSWIKGIIEEGFKESDLVFEHTFTTQLAHQGYIEPHACVVEINDAGRVQVWVNNKAPFPLRSQLASVLGLPEKHIRLNPCTIGGDFGGKGSFMDVPLCYYLALHSGRPVKMVMTYIEELMASTPRHPTVISIKSGLKKDGTLWAHQATVVFNSGAYGAFIPRVYINGAHVAAGCYRIPHVRIDCHMVYTNNVPCGHMRAPGEPQAVFAMESHIDMIAKELGIDPLEFRLKNVLQQGDSSPTGERWRDIRAEETLNKAAKAAQWGLPKPRPNIGRGIATAQLASGLGESTAKVEIDEKAKVTLHTPVLDTGAGAHIFFRQIVAEEMSIPIDEVSLTVVDTEGVPFDTGVGASRVSYSAGQATLGAVQQVKRRLAILAAELFGWDKEHVTFREGRCFPEADPAVGIPLTELAARAIHHWGRPIIAENTFNATEPDVTSFCTQVAEVEVEVDTGQVHVNRIVTAHDVGTIINPMAHQGQIDGAIIQGLGYTTMEEMLSEDGRISTLSLGDYKIPTISDIPELVTLLIHSATGPVPFHGKSIGENGIAPVAGAIANAVYDAVGVRIQNLPITAEKVLLALKEKRSSERG